MLQRAAIALRFIAAGEPDRYVMNVVAAMLPSRLNWGTASLRAISTLQEMVIQDFAKGLETTPNRRFVITS